MTDNNTEKTNVMTVKTGYARAALMILSANVILTGYALVSLINLQQDISEEQNLPSNPQALSANTSTAESKTQ